MAGLEPDHDPIWNGTGGSAAGKEIARQWCKQNPDKYEQDETVSDTWSRITSCPPDTIGARTLFALADAEHPNWEAMWNYDHPETAVDVDADDGETDDTTTDDTTGTATDDNTKQQSTPPPKPSRALMETSAQFAANFVTPDYLIEDFLQRRFLYSLTGMTGHGKTAVAAMLPDQHQHSGCSLPFRCLLFDLW
jgi:Primase C terminal 2 (PriCT-2)